MVLAPRSTVISGVILVSGLSLPQPFPGSQSYPARPVHFSGTDPSKSTAPAIAEKANPTTRTVPRTTFMEFSFFSLRLKLTQHDTEFCRQVPSLRQREDRTGTHYTQNTFAARLPIRAVRSRAGKA